MKCTCSALVLVLFLVSQGTAQGIKAPTNDGLPKLMPSDREIALALSAAPRKISEHASVYVLERDGYVLARKGSNGFTCLVVRDYPEDLGPVCHDPEGTRTVVPRLLREAELRARGKSQQQIREEINEGLRTGEFRVPQRVGVAYMLSHEAVGFIPELGHAIPIKPHVMFYAPHLRNEDIGAQAPKPQDFPYYPFVISDGEFNAYILMRVPDNDDPVPPPPPHGPAN